MAKIKEISALEILDSRGNPTVEAKVILEDGSTAVSSVPSGASLGSFEAVELRDNDPFRYRGMGVLKAVANVNEIIAPLVLGLEAGGQKIIDDVLINADNTSNKSKLGANAILSVSQAVCEAQATSLKLPNYEYINRLYGQISGLNPKSILPRPCFNLINGGKHGAGNNLQFQEFHLIFSAQFPFEKSLAAASAIYQSLGRELSQNSLIYTIGDEGGYAPNLPTNKDAFNLLVKASEKSGFKPFYDVYFGLDAAANSFKNNGLYVISDCPNALTKEQLMDFYSKLVDDFDLIYLEDPLTEDDWPGWQKLTQKIKKPLIVGDDLLCTNPERIGKAIAEKSCTTVLIKPNQVGTITETFKSIALAQKAGLKVVVSHRSGETNEDFIADLAVGVGAQIVKFGAPARGERMAKYNRLLEIEKEITGIIT